jgi:hypothetical protein
MSDPSSGVTFRTIQEAMPEYHISASLLDCVLVAMPPPPPGASAAWCRERLEQVIDEIAARVPMDAAQGHLAAQCVLAEFLAENMAARIRTPGLTMMEVRQVNGMADRLMCTVTRMERALERRQARVMPFRDTKALDGFDLDALEVVWRRGMPGLGAAGSGSPVAVGAGDVATGAAPPPAAPEPEVGHVAAVSALAGAGGAAAAGDAERGSDAAAGAGTSDGHDRRSRAGVTLEQGDGWSREVWPARAGGHASLDRAAPDALTDKGAKSGVRIADRAATDRPGSQGVA